ncbi:hypothetical protein KY284_020579 [Solanum tuberosum]|nr:hypothetical protein KY284_020579 [Solanum tuberosum]
MKIELNSPSSSRAATDHSERHVLHSTAQEAHERFTVADTNSGTGILDSCLQNNLNFKSFGERKEKYLGGILYAHGVVRKWFPVGLTDDSQCDAPTCFYGPKSGENPISLVLMQGCSEGTNELMDEPWLLVAKSVMKDLLLSFRHVKCEMKGSNMEELKPTVVACFGKILFHGTLLSLLNPMHVSTCNPPQILCDVGFLQIVKNPSKEILQLRTWLRIGGGEGIILRQDNLRSDSTAACKCTVIKDQGKIQLHKSEVNQVRNMVADMSSLGKSLDLRLMLHTKKIITALSDEEINGINNLIGSAILDSEVKGGLRWPFGEDSLGSQYTVIDVWHATAKSYGNSSIRFKLRHPD